MKKFVGIFAFLMIALATLAVSVSAAPSMTVTDINLGGSTQQRSNPLSDSESKFDIYVEGTLTITNNGDENIGSLVATFAPEGEYTAADLNATVTLAAITVAQGASTTAAVKMRVPKYLDSIDAAFTKTGMKVGAITVTGTSGTTSTALSKTASVTIQAKNMLEIKDIDMVITGAETRTESGKDEKTIKDIKPGDKIEVTIQVENDFRERDNVDIEDILIYVFSEDADFDVDEEDDISSLSPGEADSITVEFEVDEDQDRGEYDIIIEVDGVDENGARHGEKWTMTFKVERESHELQIRSATLMPESVKAGETTELKVTVRNIGRHDEDEAVIAIAAPELKFGEILSKLEIDENDDLTKRFTIPVPEDLAAGNYRIEIRTYYNNDEESDEVMVLLKVAAAEAKQPEAPADLCASVVCQDTTKICADGFVATCINTCDSATGRCSSCTPSCEGHGLVVPPVTGEAVAEPEVTKKTEVSPWYIGGLVALNVLVLIIGIFLIVRLTRR